MIHARICCPLRGSGAAMTALRDKILAVARETAAQHPELAVGDILDALNDVYCSLLDGVEVPK